MPADGTWKSGADAVKFLIEPAHGAGLTTLLVFLSVTNPFAFHIFLPSLPGLAATFDASPAMTQLTVSLYVAAFAFAQLAYGPLSDRFGRRRVTLTGLAIYTVAPLLCAGATSIEALAAGRALQAVGGCAGLMFARVVARDLHGRNRAAGVIGLVTMITALATATTPMLGGYLDVWLGWRASFWCSAGLGAAVFAATFLWLPETRPVAPVKGAVRTLVDGVQLLRSPVFLGLRRSRHLHAVGVVRAPVRPALRHGRGAGPAADRVRPIFRCWPSGSCWATW